MKPTVLVVSCEHPVNTIPPAYQHLFNIQPRLLTGPKAYDLGALEVSNHLKENLHCDVIQASVSRLLIDCDHSIHHSHCFSKFTKKLTASEKKQLIDSYYTPFHEALSNSIARHIAEQKQVLHLSIHSFAPILDGLIQNTGIGILYDSHRHGEKEVARLIHGLLLQQTTPYRLRLNHPFSGAKDYILHQFRSKYEQKDYLGIKMEINQALMTRAEDLTALCSSLSHSFGELLVLL